MFKITLDTGQHVLSYRAGKDAPLPVGHVRRDILHA
jgi:hypothetical protein